MLLGSSRYSISVSQADSTRRRSRNLTAMSMSGSQGILKDTSKLRPDTIDSSPNIQFPHQPKSLFTEEASDLPLEPVIFLVFTSFNLE